MTAALVKVDGRCKPGEFWLAPGVAAELDRYEARRRPSEVPDLTPAGHAVLGYYEALFGEDLGEVGQ